MPRPVQILKAVEFGDPKLSDHRREIVEVVFEDMDWPFAIRQVKVIAFTQEAINNLLAVGNHYHMEESGREEVFVACGPKDTDLFLFLFSPAGIERNIRRLSLRRGDCCYIPPGNSHTFVPLTEGVTLWGFSNKKYDSGDDVPDKLF